VSKDAWNRSEDRRVFADNRVFNVNGQGKENLTAVLDLVFSMTGHAPMGWKHEKKCGIILFWAADEGDGVIPFPSELSAEETALIVLKYLDSDKAKEVELSGWDCDCDHDGHNTRGWRVYCDDWGHVNNCWRAFIAIKPAYMWHGK